MTVDRCGLLISIRYLQNFLIATFFIIDFSGSAAFSKEMAR